MQDLRSLTQGADLRWVSATIVISAAQEGMLSAKGIRQACATYGRLVEELLSTSYCDAENTHGALIAAIRESNARRHWPRLSELVRLEQRQLKQAASWADR